MNKKAFVLMETIVVIVVISVALLTIFASYNKILSKVKTENKYDTSEYIYMTNYIRKHLKKLEEDDTYSCIFGDNKKIYEMGEAEPGETTRGKELTNYFNNDCFPDITSTNPFNIKKIYLLKYLNETDAGVVEDLSKFDAYMIDYIRKLDVGDNDTILVVEYGRDALDNIGEPIRPTNCDETEKENIAGVEKCKPLTETYIASLEW